MVLRRIESAHQDWIDKLSPKWEGPYKVVIIAHPNTYVLEDMHGAEKYVPHRVYEEILCIMNIDGYYTIIMFRCVDSVTTG